MSGTLGRPFTVASALGGGRGPAVTLGGVTLSGVESPEKMPFGGTQQLVTHRMPGGARVIDAMGPDDRDIEFSFGLMGSGAAAKARRFDAMRTAGAKVVLTWADDYREVVIQSFKADYTASGQFIPCRVVCVVVPSVAPATKPTLLQQIGTDLGDALGITKEDFTDALDTAQTVVTAAKEALPVVGVLTGGGAAFQALTGAVGAAQGVVSGGVAAADGKMGGLVQAGASAGNLLGVPAGSGAMAVTALTSATAAAGTLAGLTTAQGYVGRAVANLARAGV